MWMWVTQASTLKYELLLKLDKIVKLKSTDATADYRL